MKQSLGGNETISWREGKVPKLTKSSKEIIIEEDDEPREQEIVVEPSIDEANEYCFYLSCIPYQERDTWIRVGYALANELGNCGRELFLEWSSRFEDSKIHGEWMSDWETMMKGEKKNTKGTLIYLAKLHNPKAYKR